MMIAIVIVIVVVGMLVMTGMLVIMLCRRNVASDQRLRENLLMHVLQAGDRLGKVRRLVGGRMMLGFLDVSAVAAGGKESQTCQQGQMAPCRPKECGWYHS